MVYRTLKLQKYILILLFILISTLTTAYFSTLYSPNHDVLIPIAQFALKFIQNNEYPTWFAALHSSFQYLHYPIAIFVKLFGFSDIVFFIVGTLLITLSVMAVYIISKELFDYEIALTASLLFSLCTWRIMSVNVSYLISIVIFGIYFSLSFLLLAFRTNKNTYYLLSGILFAVGFLSWTQGVVILPVLLVCFAWALINYKISYLSLFYFIIGILGTVTFPLAYGILNRFGGSGVFPQWLFVKSHEYGNFQFDHNIYYHYSKQIKRLFYSIYQLYPNIILIICVVGIIVVLRDGKNIKGKSIMMIWLVISLLMLPFINSTSSNQIESRYMLMFMPIPYIYSAVTIQYLKKYNKVLSYLLLSVVIIFQTLFLYNNYLWGWINKTGGWNFFIEEEVNATEAMFPGWKDACSYIKETSSDRSGVIADYDKFYGLWMQVDWYTRNKVKPIRDAKISELIQLHPSDIADKYDIDKIYYIFCILRGEQDTHSKFRSIHPHLNPDKIVYDVHQEEAIYIYSLNVNLMQKRISIRNGNFEEGKEIPYYWHTNFTGGYQTLFTWDQHIAYKGNRSIAMSSEDNSQAAWVSDEIRIFPNKMYSVGAWVKTENLTKIIKTQDGGLCIQIEFFDDKRNVIQKIESQFVNGTFDWKYIKKGFLSPKDAKIMKISFVKYSCKGKVWIDNIELSELL